MDSQSRRPDAEARTAASAEEFVDEEHERRVRRRLGELENIRSLGVVETQRACLRLDGHRPRPTSDEPPPADHQAMTTRSEVSRCHRMLATMAHTCFSHPG